MKESAYKESGVDIDAADQLIERIKPLAKSTARAGVMAGLGGFGALFDLRKTPYKDPVLVSSTDGVGTKIKIAIDLGKHDTIGIDCVAMCVNDIVVQGAEPLFFLDYFATGKLENDVAERVIAGIARGCKESGCALIGGETAEMPGLYAPGDYDLAGFSVGAVERDQIITGENIKEDDVILGLASSGLHSNGFSLVRHLVKSSQGVSYEKPAPFDASRTLGDIVLTPTKLYVLPVLEALKIKDKDGKPAIRGMAHITGGGITENVPRVLPETLAAQIDAKAWTLPPVFRFLKEIGRLEAADMAVTLNCGIGMVVVCAKDHADAIEKVFKEQKETVYRLGRIVKRKDSPVILDGLNTWK
ncbi:MAG: phosphoribosylformylglycinamidine cyclo-ligase [Alphaproteobacteria bacterium]|nr:phosphoribosylformylglycinamidine cyclo-ligase [Alphaproteobacteria bacterium]